VARIHCAIRRQAGSDGIRHTPQNAPISLRHFLNQEKEQYIERTQSNSCSSCPACQLDRCFRLQEETAFACLPQTAPSGGNHSRPNRTAHCHAGRHFGWRSGPTHLAHNRCHLNLHRRHWRCALLGREDRHSDRVDYLSSGGSRRRRLSRRVSPRHRECAARGCRAHQHHERGRGIQGQRAGHLLRLRHRRYPRRRAGHLSAKDASYLASHPDVKIVLGGYCDERGSDEYNLALGQNRADAAKNALVTAGVAPNRIRVVSYGKEKPFCTESNEAMLAALNRRAGFSIDQ
jgi:hypothetical protein